MKIEEIIKEYASATKLVEDALNIDDIKQAFEIFNKAYMVMDSKFGHAFIALYSDFSNAENYTKYLEIYNDISKYMVYPKFVSSVLKSRFLAEIKELYGEVLIETV